MNIQTAWTIDWSTLTNKTADYNTLNVATDPISGLVDITCCGLYAKLSTILAKAPENGAHSIAIFVDTLEVDVPALQTSGLIIVARQLLVGELNGKPLELMPRQGGVGAAQFMIGLAVNGDFTIGSKTPVKPAVGMTTLSVPTYTITEDGSLKAIPDGGLHAVQDLVSRSWVMNSLRASFTAGARLMDDGSTQALAEAQSMLAWVVRCNASLAGPGQPMPSDYAQLYTQAAALLVTLNVSPGAKFVPVLSNSFYGQQMTRLLGVVKDYEGLMATLTTQQNIAQAIQTVSDAIAGSAGDEVAPLQTQLDNIQTNSAALRNDIRNLYGDFLIQSNHATTAFSVLNTVIKLESIKATLKAEMEGAISVISLGFDAIKISAGDLEGLKSAVEDGAKAVQSLVETIEASQQSGASENLANGAIELLNNQNGLMQALLNAQTLWNQGQKDQTGAPLPASPAAITIDPVTSWDNYLAAAEAEIDSLKSDLNNNAKEAANTYLASIKILVGFGKAISTKLAALAAQLVQATVVQAQINAAQQVETRWQAVEAQASTDAEKLAALKALVKGRSDAVMRSLYVAWTYYATSYYYLNLANPPRVVHLDMNAAEIADALNGVAAWVAAALAAPTADNRIKLPSTQAQIELDFAVLQPGAQAGSEPTAVLAATKDGGWTLTWTVPLGSEQLQGVLPNDGKCAIWITQAAFYLEGVTANSKGNLLATIATSGAYQNGYGTNDSSAFSTNGLTGNYAYHVEEQEVYSPWQINTAVYMTPTPYTQWSMTVPAHDANLQTATRLKMELTISYATPN